MYNKDAFVLFVKIHSKDFAASAAADWLRKTQ